MSERKSNATPSILWVLMHHGYLGWIPSSDYPFVWRTRRAALSKIKSLGEKGKMYKPFKYILSRDPK